MVWCNIFLIKQSKGDRITFLTSFTLSKNITIPLKKITNYKASESRLPRKDFVFEFLFLITKLSYLIFHRKVMFIPKVSMQLGCWFWKCESFPVGLDKWLSSSELMMLFVRTRVWFSVTMLGDSQKAVT